MITELTIFDLLHTARIVLTVLFIILQALGVSAETVMDMRHRYSMKVESVI